jgi:hypothetical protein
MRDFSEFFEGPPESWPDKIVAIGARDDQPRWHVRDQESLIRALPPCPVAPADRDGLAPATLATYPATLWLPPGATPAEYEEDEDSATGEEASPRPLMLLEGWDWPDGASLQLMIGTSPELPARYALSRYDAEDRRADLGGRPVRVRRYAQADDAGRLTHWAVVDGFLGDAHTVYAAVDAAAPSTRDAILAALLTWAPDQPTRPDVAAGRGG